MLAKYLNGTVYGLRRHVNQTVHSIQDYYCYKSYTNKYAWRLGSYLGALNSDIVHIHNHFGPLRLLKRARVRKPMIYHDHGGGLAAYAAEWKPIMSLADKVVSALPLIDLDGIEYVPNMADPELFQPVKRVQNGRGRIILKPGMGKSRTAEWLRAHGYGDIDWDYVDLSENVCAFKDLPQDLAAYEYVADVDLRWGASSPYEIYNLIGLQAMAMGIRTICYDGEHTSLPQQHTHKYVLKQWRRIYKDLSDNIIKQE